MSLMISQKCRCNMPLVRKPKFASRANAVLVVAIMSIYCIWFGRDLDRPPYRGRYQIQSWTLEAILRIRLHRRSSFFGRWRCCTMHTLKCPLNAVGEEYPYFMPISIIFSLPLCKSIAAKDIRLRRIYSESGIPAIYANILWKWYVE